MTKKNPTMRDVAKFAGVALGTVDRYINGTGVISDAKRESVRKAIESLNYVPNKAASALSQGRAIMIGVIFPYIESSFWQQIENGINRAGREFGAYGLRIHPIHISNYSIDLQLKAINELVAMGVQGIAMVPMHENLLNDTISKLADNGIPIVTFDSDAPLSRRICFVGVDDQKCGEMAARMLAMLLHEDGKVIVFRAQRNLYAVQQRIVGFGKKIAQYPNVYVAHEYDIYDESENFEQHLRKVIRSQFPHEGIHGIFVTNGTADIIGSLLAKESLAYRYRIVGFDLTEGIERLLADGIIDATIYSDIEQQGYQAIRILYEKIAWRIVPEQTYHFTNPQIIIKEML